MNKFTLLALGYTNASFCPHAYGCRNVLVSENQIILDVTDHEVFLTVQIPTGKMLWLVSKSSLFELYPASWIATVTHAFVSLQDYVLVVPEVSYSSSYLNEELLDKSYDFISSCGQNSFHIESVSRWKMFHMWFCFTFTDPTLSLLVGS